MKEEKINSVLELNENDVVLISSPFGDDICAVVSLVSNIDKYCITSKGRKCRSTGSDFIFAEDEGLTGNEKIKSLDLIAEVGSFNFDEDKELTEWNVRIIDDTHPKYNKDLVNYSKQFSNVMDMFKNMFEE